MANSWADWGLEDSIDFPGSDSFEALTVPVTGSGGLGAMWDPSLLRLDLKYGDLIPSDWGSSLSSSLGTDWLSGLNIPTGGFKITPSAEKIIAENLPYISDNFYGSDVVIPGQLGGFNPDAGSGGFSLPQDPGYYLDQYGLSLEDALKAVDGESLGPSGRPHDNVAPGMGSAANTSTGGAGAPGTQSGPSTREPSETSTSGGTKSGTTSGTKTGASIGSVLGGLAAAGLLGKVLGLFDSSGSGDKYTGIKMPRLSDIPVPDTPQISPVRVVPVPVQVPVVPQEAKDLLAKRLGSTPLAQGGLAHLATPLFAHGGRLDFRHGAPVVGEGTGQSDDIPALLSDGEYVIDADTVAALGDGSNKAGAAALDKFREQIRKHKRSAPHDKIPPKAKSPLAYLKEVK